jgi:hypothetical protein
MTKTFAFFISVLNTERMLKLLQVSKGSIVGLIFASLLVTPQALAQESKPFGAYRLFSQGSGRVMAMGGTFVAIVDDATAAGYNPSGAALATWRLDFGGTNNRIDDRADLQQNSYSSYQTVTEAYSFINYAVAARAGSFVFGLGLSTPYQYHYSDYLQNTSIVLIRYNAMLAWRMGNNFAIGVSGHHEDLKEHFDQGSSSGDARGSALTISAGALYRTRKAGIGAVYFQGHEILVKEDGGASTAIASWLRNVMVPSATCVGGFYRMHERFTIAVDVDRFEIPRNLVDASSELQMVGEVSLVPGALQVIHGGFEWILIEDRHMNLVFRGGGYVEPARVLDSASRFHRTYGLEVQFGPAVLTVSFDQASNFTNTTQGFSLVLGAI